jgi:hypothetical protein
MQWHPIYAALLRAVLEEHCEVQTKVTVGDVPREADIVVVRRSTSGPLPYTGMWRLLTPWNVVEFKGKTVSARLRDLDLLVELGLGVQRHLDKERAKEEFPGTSRDELTMWYIASHIGERFIRGAGVLLGRPLEVVEPGIWRAEILRRPVLLVGSTTVGVNRDSLPMHALCGVPVASRGAVAEILAAEPKLVSVFASWMAFNESEIWQELIRMAAERGSPLVPDLQPLIDNVGAKEIIRQMGARRAVAELGLDGVLAVLTPEEVEELVAKAQATRQGNP